MFWSYELQVLLFQQIIWLKNNFFVDFNYWWECSPLENCPESRCGSVELKMAKLDDIPTGWVMELGVICSYPSNTYQLYSRATTLWEI